MPLLTGTDDEEEEESELEDNDVVGNNVELMFTPEGLEETLPIPLSVPEVPPSTCDDCTFLLLVKLLLPILPTTIGLECTKLTLMASGFSSFSLSLIFS